MKALPFENKHKEKLLEMVKLLYPEFNIHWDEKRLHEYMLTIDPEWSFTIEMLKNRGLKRNKPTWMFADDMIIVQCHLEMLLCIHWFEFCVYHLSVRIQKMLINTKYEFFVTAMLKPDHPVDYLYQQFKYI